MKRKSKSGLEQYLEACGMLDTGSPEDIARCRKAYWNECKRRYKKEKSEREHSFTVWLTDTELTVISEAARLHSLSRTRYIKLSALAYANKTFLVMNKEQVDTIKMLLARNYGALQEIVEQNAIPQKLCIALLDTIENLEKEVISQFTNPKAVQSDH